jgi:hypothetical protein
MTWVLFIRDYRHSTMRYTENFNEGEVRNLPRHTADEIESKGGCVKEVKKREKPRKDEAEISETTTW